MSFLCFTRPLYGSDSTGTASRRGTFGNDVAAALHDAGSFFSAPFHFSSKEWHYTAGAAGATLFLMSLDRSVKNSVGNGVRGSLNGDFLDIPTRYGVVTYANLFAVATYTTGWIVGNDGIRVTGRLMFESLALSGITVISMRYIAGRARPYGDNGPWDFHWFETRNAVQSFPSGHATVAFAFSTVLAERIDTFWSRIAFYGMATMTAYARVYNHQHWSSDVVVAAGLGMLAGFHVVREEERRSGETTSGASRLQFYPALSGIRIEYSLH